MDINVGHYGARFCTDSKNHAACCVGVVMAEIIQFPGVIDSSVDGKNVNRNEVEALLEQAREQEISEVLILGIDEEGELYINSNIHSEKTIIWAIEKFKNLMLNLQSR